MKKVTIILGSMVMVALLLLTSGCESTRYNITGTWTITTRIQGQLFDEDYTFVGDNRAGDVLFQGTSLGTYAVNGDEVSFTLRYYDADDDFTVEVYSGYFDDDYTMSGTFTYSVEGYQTLSGSWIAER